MNIQYQVEIPEMAEKDEKFEIDFSRRETEAGWIEIYDRFGLTAAPVWFNWLGWIFVLGTLDFLYNQSGNILLLVLIIASYGLLYFYFFGFFFRFKFKGILFLASPRRESRGIAYGI